MELKCLDLCCGRGGWSKGFNEEGFDCTGVDIVDVGYPFNLILADLRSLKGAEFKDYPVIVGSPPCRDFCNYVRAGRKYWKDPPNTERGLELVYAFLQFVEDAKPRYWLMENVAGLIKYIDLKPIMITRLTRGKRRAFWGNFPLWLVPRDMTHMPHDTTQGRKGLALRAEIPLPTSLAFAQAIKRQGGS